MDVVLSSTLTPQSLSSTPAENQIESDPVMSVENETGVQSASSDAVLSSKYDTLELSQDYLNYKTQNGSSSLGGSENSNEADSFVYSYELYSYSDSELKTLVSDGTITRAQYNTEMAKRQSNSIEE